MSVAVFRGAIVAMSMAAALAGATRADADEPANGEAQYKAHCAACHGESGAGDGPAAPALRSPPPDLRALSVRNDGVFPEKVLETVIDGRKTVRAHGSFEMPVWGRELSQGSDNGDAAKRVAMSVQYLRGIQRK
ncbi:MAG: cytochrome c [Proteobacteria bacterium]|nr:cytochrome c [Pseudomonadota bacterium]